MEINISKDNIIEIVVNQKPVLVISWKIGLTIVVIATIIKLMPL